MSKNSASFVKPFVGESDENSKTDENTGEFNQERREIEFSKKVTNPQKLTN